MTDSPEVERYRSVAHRLHDIAHPIRVLSALRWPAAVRQEFLAGGGESLPAVEYAPHPAALRPDHAAAAQRTGP